MTSSSARGPGAPPLGVPKPITIVRLNDLAYTKLILHALKYPHNTVNGLLLGKWSPDALIDIVDAVPLLHNWIDPKIKEVGLEMVRPLPRL
jgi:hypothetical protein